MSDFTNSMDQQLDGISYVSTGALANCDECWDGFTDRDDDEARELAEEPSFSWYPCDGCGSVLGGDRHPAHGVLEPDDKPQRIQARMRNGATRTDAQHAESERDTTLHLDICTDCLFYLANGDEPEDWQGALTRERS